MTAVVRDDVTLELAVLVLELVELLELLLESLQPLEPVLASLVLLKDAVTVLLLELVLEELQPLEPVLRSFAVTRLLLVVLSLVPVLVLVVEEPELLELLLEEQEPLPEWSQPPVSVVESLALALLSLELLPEEVLEWWQPPVPPASLCETVMELSAVVELAPTWAAPCHAPAGPVALGTSRPSNRSSSRRKLFFGLALWPYLLRPSSEAQFQRMAASREKVTRGPPEVLPNREGAEAISYPACADVPNGAS